MAIMKQARIKLISQYPFRIDGVNVVCKKCHQHEKDSATKGSYFGELSRSGDHAGITQAGANFAKWNFKHHRLVKSEGLAGDSQPGE